MTRQSVKAAKRSAKAARRPVKKGAKPVAESARSADKAASKSARSPVGKSTPTKSTQFKSTQFKSTQSKSTHSAQATSLAASRASSKIVEKIMRTASPPMQPVAAHEIVLKSHKYHVGEVVYYTSPTFGRAAATGSYTVVKLLPSEGEDYQYRIKSSGEAFERVAKESQLEKI
jgi:hypothetical protein